MKKISLFLLAFLFVSVFDLHSQINSLKLLAQIDKYKIYATLVDGKQVGNSIQDTSSEIIHSTTFFLSEQDSIFSYIKSDSILYIITGYKQKNSSSPQSIIPIAIFNNIQVDPFKSIFLPLDIIPEGLWEKNKWYCTRNYSFINTHQILGVEKCSLLQSDGILIREKNNILFLIDYNSKTVNEIKRVKIE